MILLDTHVWVRWVDPQANPLSPGLLDCIETAEQLAVSAVTCWEVAWLARRGRADRFIIATAIERQARLISLNNDFPAYLEYVRGCCEP